MPHHHNNSLIAFPFPWLFLPCSNPYTSTCPHLRMFNLTNHYYKDACSPTITIKYQRPPLDFPDTGVVEMNDPEFNSFRAEQVCKVSSPLFWNYCCTGLN